MRFKSLIAIASLVFLAAPTAALGRMHHVDLTARPHIKHWASHQTYGPKATVEIAVLVGDGELGTESQGCRLYYAGDGMAVNINVCGQRATHLRINYVAFSRIPVTFRVEYGSI